MIDPVYVADPPTERHAVVLETLVAVFHVRSGMTHLLVSPAPEILHVLEQGPATADTILARLTERHDVEKDGARVAIVARLEELEASGLVWRI